MDGNNDNIMSEKTSIKLVDMRMDVLDGCINSEIVGLYNVM